MKLTNMKLAKEDLEATKPASESVLADQPIYPWGLQVRLDEKALDKLGMSDLPKVGGELVLIARVNVTSVSSNEHAGAKGKHKHRSVELQITDMCLEDPPASKDAAAELYEKAK